MKTFLWGLLFTVTAVVVAGVVLLNLNLLRVEFGEEKKTPELHLGGKTVEMPIMTLEPDVGSTAKLLGYDKVYVIRAQHGVLEGSVRFDGEDKKTLNQTEFAKAYVEKHRDKGTSSFSAVVIVALKKVKGPKTEGKNEYDCQVILLAEARTPGKDTGDVKANDEIIKKGKVTIAEGQDSPHVATSDTSVLISKNIDEKKKATWLELKVVEAPK